MNRTNENAAESRSNCTADGCERKAIRRANGQPVCGMHYQRWWKRGDINYHRKEFKKCIVSGCSDLPRSRYSEYCEKHYMRVRRRGTTEKHQPSPTIQHSHGYVRAYAPDHPLTARVVGNYEYQHRLVFYDTHGEGPFRCHWCNKQVTWDDMHVDHLNSVKHDNRPENLVPSCALCNQWRGQERMKKTMRDKYSIKLTFRGVEKTLGEWADELGISRTALKWRLNNGWSVERALTEPRGKYGPKRNRVGGGSKV